jgi:hypothetical protein
MILTCFLAVRYTLLHETVRDSARSLPGGAAAGASILLARALYVARTRESQLGSSLHVESAGAVRACNRVCNAETYLYVHLPQPSDCVLCM